MVENALTQAMEQLSLLLFTTLSPAGACAFLIIALLIFFGRYTEAQCMRLGRFTVIPIAFALAGVIASTNHLGKPSNSLFVLSGIGRSPLSNEVAAAVVFMGLAWVFWMLSFSSRARRALSGFVLGLGVFAALAHIWFTANAYNIHTIVTWHLPFTQVNQILAACMGGPVIALLTLRAAKMSDNRWLLLVLTLVAAASTVALLVSQLLQFLSASQLESALESATAVLTYQPFEIVLSFGLAVGSCTLLFAQATKDAGQGAGQGSSQAVGQGEGQAVGQGRTASLLITVLACALMLSAVAVSRFAFYGMYLTAGI